MKNNFKYGYQIDLNSDSTAASVINLVGENKDVLEFGCSYGYMSDVLKVAKKCRVTGVEIDEDAANIARDICEEVIIGNAELIDFNSYIKGKLFDVIVFADVLEHLVDPQKLLIKMKSYLKEDGYIVASVPNISYLAVIMELISNNFKYRKLGILDETHLRFFTKDTIIKMFEESGFYIKAIKETKIPLQNSEFKLHEDKLNKEVLEYIKANNPDWDTYQLVLKACKSSEASKLGLYSQKIDELEEKIKDYLVENNKLSEYVSKLENDINEVKKYADSLNKDYYLINKKSILYKTFKKLLFPK